MGTYEPFGGNISGNEIDVGDVDVSGSDDPATAFFLGNFGSGSGNGERDTAGNEFDPTIHVGRDKLNGDGTFRKKRGRKVGSSTSRNRQARPKADISASVDSLARIISYAHLGLAATVNPILALKDEESKALAEATANVLSEFDIRPNPKVEAILGLVFTASGIYGPRVYFIWQSKKNEQNSGTE